jgi:branched-subunit amino acid transport protein AzlD
MSALVRFGPLCRLTSDMSQRLRSATSSRRPGLRAICLCGQMSVQLTRFLPHSVIGHSNFESKRRYMNNRCGCSMLLLSTVLSFGAVTSAASAELKVWTSRAIFTVLEVVGAQFERETGNKLTVVSGFSPEFIKRINAGEQFDILAAPPPVLDNMIKAGKLKADTRTLLVSSDVGSRFAPAHPSRISVLLRHSNRRC